MHVLGLPPAFVLSQDQTLKLELIRLHPGGITRVDANLHSMFLRAGRSRSPINRVCVETSDSRSFCLKSLRQVTRGWLLGETRQDAAVHVSLSQLTMSKSWNTVGCPDEVSFAVSRFALSFPRGGGRFRPQTRCPVKRLFEDFFDFFAVVQNLPRSRENLCIPCLILRSNQGLPAQLT